MGDYKDDKKIGVHIKLRADGKLLQNNYQN
jgi:hypothetical protein